MIHVFKSSLDKFERVSNKSEIVLTNLQVWKRLSFQQVWEHFSEPWSSLEDVE